MYKKFYLYVLKDDRNNYKIGISENPFLRLGEIKFHNPTTKFLFSRGYVGDDNIQEGQEKDITWK